MKQYIDKDELMTVLKKRRSKNARNKLNLAASFEDNYLLSLIDTLEVKELEEKFKQPSTKIEDSECVDSRMKYIDDDLKPIAKLILSFAHWNLRKDEWNQPVLEVPLFRVLDALIQR